MYIATRGLWRQQRKQPKGAKHLLHIEIFIFCSNICGLRQASQGVKTGFKVSPYMTSMNHTAGLECEWNFLSVTQDV